MDEIRKVPANTTIARPVGGPRGDREKESERDSFKRILSGDQEEVPEEAGDLHPDDDERGEGKSLPGDDARGLLIDQKV